MNIDPHEMAIRGRIGGRMLHANHDTRELAARARRGISQRWINEARARYGDLGPEELERRADLLYRADMARRSRLAVAARKRPQTP